ncbi:MAG: hypothetical protein QXL34_06375, partial [Thermosphaera sp.]
NTWSVKRYIVLHKNSEISYQDIAETKFEYKGSILNYLILRLPKGIEISKIHEGKKLISREQSIGLLNKYHIESKGKFSSTIIIKLIKR